MPGSRTFIGMRACLRAMALPRVGAVTLNYKTPDQTEAAVRSLLASVGVTMSVVLVENGSADGSRERLKAAFGHEPRVELIASETNLGFAGGNNLGIRRLLDRGAEFVFLVSSDVVAEPDCAARLVEVLEAHAAASAQPVMLRPGGDLVDTLGHKLMPDSTVVDISGGQPLPQEVLGKDWEIFGVCAGAALYRGDIFRDIGMLAEDFFIYYEDVDLGFRIRLAGGKALLVTSARARHTRHGSAGGFALKHYYAERNLVAVRIRHSTLRGVATLDTLGHVARGLFEAVRHRRKAEYVGHLLRALVAPRTAGARERRAMALAWTGVERRPLPEARRS